MKVFKVQIVSHGGGGIIDRHVWAQCSKDALAKVIESLAPDADCWQWPGWQVQVYEEQNAFIIGERP